MGDHDKDQQRAQRHEQKRQRLGTPNPVCTTCGYLNLPPLLGVPFFELPQRLKRRLSREHHLARRAAGDWIVIVCRNCHEILDDAQ